MTEVVKSQARYSAIAKDYAAKPEDTIIVSPDNRSRQEINQAVRTELQAKGAIAPDNQTFQTLNHRSDITGADRAWAVRYQPGNVVRYTTGSKELGIERGSSATVLSTNARENTITVEKRDGQTVTYNPQRLRGVNVFETAQREFARGDRLQFTAPNKDQGIRAGSLATVENIAENGALTVKQDNGRRVELDPAKARHIEHGYAVDGSKAVPAQRVLVSIARAPEITQNCLVHTAISRASKEAVRAEDRGTLVRGVREPGVRVRDQGESGVHARCGNAAQRTKSANFGGELALHAKGSR